MSFLGFLGQVLGTSSFYGTTSLLALCPSDCILAVVVRPPLRPAFEQCRMPYKSAPQGNVNVISSPRALPNCSAAKRLRLARRPNSAPRLGEQTSAVRARNGETRPLDTRDTR